MFARTAIILALATSAAAETCDGATSICDAAALLQGKMMVESTRSIPDALSKLGSIEMGPDGIKINIGSAEPAKPKVNWKAAWAEYLAMTLFVIIGCGSAMMVAKDAGWVLQVSLTFGLAITSLAYTVGHWSGAQINCAVTLGLVIAGQVTIEQGMANFLMQMLGSVTGALILTLIIPEDSDKTGGLATNAVAGNVTKMNAFVGEVLMTFLLMIVVMETAVNPDTKANREMAAVAIGFAVFLAHSVLINIDGCSINPTRTFGPALVRQLCYKKGTEAAPAQTDEKDQNAAAPKANPHLMCLEEQLVFWAGPLLGAAAAVGVSVSMR